MPTDCIPFRDTNYFSKFICDYLDQHSDLKSFYNNYPTLDNFKLQIEEKSNTFNHTSRLQLVSVLKTHYNTLETSEKTKLNIESLSETNTFTITTGHQLNLFTGPLYFLYKIISTINLTEQLKAKYPNYNFVPIYWMASEDHDFDEINYFNFKGSKVQWNSKQQGVVGHFKTKGLDAIFTTIKTLFGNSKNALQLQQWFNDAYLKHDDLASATRYLANKLFGDLGLVILDADHRDLKRLFVPYAKDELINNTGFKEVNATNKALKDLDLKIQVNPREINLFYISEGIRERIIYENDLFKVHQTEIKWTTEALLKELETYPERFSPNVIMRPLYQEVILPNLCYIGGGGELIYWLQLKSNFKAQKVTFPMLLLRNSALLRSSKQKQKLQKLSVSNADLFLKRNDLLKQKTKEISKIKIDFSEQITHLNQQFKQLHQLAELTDKSFKGAVNAQEKKQINGLVYLEKRLLRAQKRKLSDVLERMANLQEQLFPNNSLQERYLNFSELYLEYGDALIPALKAHLQPLKQEFIIIDL